MARVTYQVVKLVGYTNGKPSWSRIPGKSYPTRPEAQAKADEMQQGQSKTEYRTRRKVIRR